MGTSNMLGLHSIASLKTGLYLKVLKAVQLFIIPNIATYIPSGVPACLVVNSAFA